MTTIVTGTEPRVKRKTFKIAQGMGNTPWADAEIRRAHNVPPDAVATTTHIEKLDVDETNYVWYEVTC